MLRRMPAALVLAIVFATIARPSAAQGSEEGRRHRIEASAGGVWLGGAGLGSEPANLRANTTPPSPFPLFVTDSRAAAAAGIDARVGYWLTRSLAIEGGVVYARPDLRTDISADVEGTPALTVEEALHQYFINASLLWLIERWQFNGRRTVPFMTGGGGYLRQLHEGRMLVESGQVYNFGGGVRHSFRQRDSGSIRALGVRIEGRAYVLVNGVQFEDSPRTHAALSGTFFVTF